MAVCTSARQAKGPVVHIGGLHQWVPSELDQMVHYKMFVLCMLGLLVCIFYILDAQMIGDIMIKSNLYIFFNSHIKHAVNMNLSYRSEPRVIQ